MIIVLLSSCVSLITLFILFFRVKNAKKRSIPSWFLGRLRKKILNDRIVITKPPIIPFVLVVLITVLFAIIYFPYNNYQNSSSLNSSALIWVDPSFSAMMSRKENNFNISEEAEKVVSLNLNNFGLSTDFNIEDGSIKLSYKIIQLDSKKDVEKFLNEKIFAQPSPFVQPIDIPKVVKLLDESKNFTDKKNTLIVFSDGLEESLEGVLALKNFFKTGILFKTAFYEKLLEKQQEIIPTDLFSLWGEKEKQSVTPFSIIDSSNSKIPIEARPLLFIENYQAGGEIFSVLKKQVNKKILPLFVVCTDRLPGALELDPYANLRTLVNFFGSRLIEKKCKAQNTNAKLDENPWKYSGSSIWIVPLNFEVMNSLYKEFKFWTPEGFFENSDSLVYIASLPLYYPSSLYYKYNKDANVYYQQIQMDPESFPINFPLAHLPPHEEIGYNSASDGREYKGTFKLFYSAEDRTSLAFKSRSLPFFFLRTTASMPNSELSRSNSWTQFWFNVATSVVPKNYFMTKLILDDVSKLDSILEEASISKTDKFSKYLNLNSLQFSDAKYFTTGLYQLSESHRLVIVTKKEGDKSRIVISGDDFSRQFNTEFNQNVSSVKMKNPSLFLLFLALLACLFLYLLWMRKKNKFHILIIFIIISVFHNKDILAKDKINNNNFSLFNLLSIDKKAIKSNKNNNTPFRISWCKPAVTSSIKDKYEKIRNILLQRGTISLPTNLLPNACKPGESEVWWLDDANAISAEELIEHVSNGGVFLLEGNADIPFFFNALSDLSTGMEWDSPSKRGMFYRSFYLLQTIDGCAQDSTKVLMLKKKVNAQAPYGLVTSARFLGNGDDCFKDDIDYKTRSIVNIIYAFLTTDYKEDQLQLPELLNRIKNLGLEP